MYDTFHVSSATFSVHNIPVTLSHHDNYHHLTYPIYGAIQQTYVITLQLTICLTTSTSQWILISYIFSTLKHRQLLQYMPKHKLKTYSCYTTQKDQQDGLYM